MKIWKTLTKVKIQIAWKYPMWVFKTTAFEPWSHRIKRKNDLSLSARGNVRKLFKSVQLIIMTKFEQFLSMGTSDLFLLCCDHGSNAVVLNTHIWYFWATWILTFVKIFQIFKWQSTKLKIWNLNFFLQIPFPYI